MTSRTFKFSSDSWTASLPSIFETNAHADVFFECERKKIAIHRTVLASQSTFLREILTHVEPSGEIPVLSLEGFRYEIVLLLVSFLYNGRVEGSSDDLIALSKYGKELQIEGLVNSGRTTQPLQLEILEQKKKQVNKQLSNLQETETDSEAAETSDDEGVKIVFEKNKPDSSQNAHSPFKRKKKEVQRSSLGSAPLNVTISDSLKRPISPTLDCVTPKKKCQKAVSSAEKSTSNLNHSFKSPVLNTFPTAGSFEIYKFKCRTCRQVFAEKQDFMTHLAEKHADILTCTICGKLLTARSTLKTHLKNHITKLDSLLNAPTTAHSVTEVPVNGPPEFVNLPVLYQE